MRLAGELVEDSAGLIEVGELFFFGAEFGRVGNKRAAGAPGGMLDVEHLVIEDVFHGALRDLGMIHAAIQQDVAGTRVVAAELAAPALCAPTNVGPD